MNVNLEQLVESIKKAEEKHRSTLRGTSGKSLDYEDGFLYGLFYIREYMIPFFETTDLDEAAAIEESMQSEIDDIKARHRFGLDEPGES